MARMNLLKAATLGFLLSLSPLAGAAAENTSPYAAPHRMTNGTWKFMPTPKVELGL